MFCIACLLTSELLSKPEFEFLWTMTRSRCQPRRYLWQKGRGREMACSRARYHWRGKGDM